MIRRSAVIPVVLALLAGPVPTLRAQADPSAVVVLLGQFPSQPVPTLSDASANKDVGDQLFLRLAVPGPTISTALEKTFRPQLAASWVRRDSLTLAFSLDPRAKWHDGVPVTAKDVVYAFDRARQHKLAPYQAPLLGEIASVTAEDAHTVVIRFRRAYPEQFYDATFHVQPLPAHLLEGTNPDSLASSAFARAPVGNGPYKWGRSVPGEFVELVPNPDFFLGAPGPSRMVFRFASDPEARINLILSGEANVAEALAPPQENRARVLAGGRTRMLAVPSYSLVYILFNQRDRGDRTRPNALFSDPDVRRALLMATDRAPMVRAIWGPYASVPFGPVGQSSWIQDAGAKLQKYDLEGARRLLASRGWRDTDGDGVLEREGVKLAFSFLVPKSSYVRTQVALIAQQQWTKLGAKVDVDVVERAVYGERRAKGDFDVDVSNANLDPSPTGLVASWSCAGFAASNVGRYCNPVVDSLIAAGRVASGDPLPIWRKLLQTIDADVPAVFVAAPAIQVGIGTQFENVTVTPWSFWSAAWTWRVRGAQPGR